MLRRYLFLPLAAACCVVSVGFAGGSPGPAQDSNTGATGKAPAAVLRAESRAVIVDVVVTQGKDEPVTGLKRQDFEITEDGKPQRIDFFEEHTVAAVPAAPLTPMPPHVYTNVPAVPPADAVSVVLLDSLNTPFLDQGYVRYELLSSMRAMPPQTRFAVFSLTDKFSMIQGFDDDPAVRASVSCAWSCWPTTTRASR